MSRLSSVIARSIGPSFSGALGQAGTFSLLRHDGGAAGARGGAALKAVKNKLDQPLGLEYALALC